MAVELLHPKLRTDVHDEAIGEGACPKAPHFIPTVYRVFSKTGNNTQHILPVQDGPAGISHCHCIFLTQPPSPFKCTKIKPLALKQREVTQVSKLYACY